MVTNSSTNSRFGNSCANESPGRRKATARADFRRPALTVFVHTAPVLGKNAALLVALFGGLDGSCGCATGGLLDSAVGPAIRARAPGGPDDAVFARSALRQAPRARVRRAGSGARRDRSARGRLWLQLTRRRAERQLARQSVGVRVSLRSGDPRWHGMVSFAAAPDCWRGCAQPPQVRAAHAGPACLVACWLPREPAQRNSRKTAPTQCSTCTTAVESRHLDPRC